MAARAIRNGDIVFCGTGLPIVLLSARLTTERILKEKGTISVQNLSSAPVAATD